MDSFTSAIVFLFVKQSLLVPFFSIKDIIKQDFFKIQHDNTIDGNMSIKPKGMSQWPTKVSSNNFGHISSAFVF